MVAVSRGGLHVRKVVGVGVVGGGVVVVGRLVMVSRGGLHVEVVGVVVVVEKVAVVGGLVMVSRGGLHVVLVSRFLHRPYRDHIGRLFGCVATGFGFLVGTWVGVGGLMEAGEASSGLAAGCFIHIDFLHIHLALFSQKGSG